MAEEQAQSWDPERIDLELPRIRSALRAEGMPEARVEEAAGRVEEALLGTLRDSVGQWLLFGDHRESWSELALTGLIDGAPVSVVIDRVILDSDGCLWVVDYKTSRHEGGGIQAFLESEKRRYAGQLQRYSTLVGSWRPECQIKTALYFPLMASWCELS
jgi:ATP-dependent exoDNAse (exonuclease V) beta subunit